MTMDKGTKSGLMALVVAAGALAGLALSEVLLPSRNISLDGEHGFYIVLKCVLTTMNMTISILLMGIYFNVYKETKAKFSIGLMLVGLALFVYATTSNPLLTASCGFCVAGLGPFTMIPDLFAALALFILLYLSDK